FTALGKPATLATIPLGGSIVDGQAIIDGGAISFFTDASAATNVNATEAAGLALQKPKGGRQAVLIAGDSFAGTHEDVWCPVFADGTTDPALQLRFPQTGRVDGVFAYRGGFAVALHEPSNSMRIAYFDEDGRNTPELSASTMVGADRNAIVQGSTHSEELAIV